MSKGKIKFNNENNSKNIENRFAGFVVDLRQKINSENKPAEKMEQPKKTEHSGGYNFKSPRGNNRSFKLNLLKKNKKSFFENLGRKFRRTIKKYFSGSAGSWMEFLNEKSRLFETAAKLDLGSFRRKNLYKKRMETAETKVVWYRSILSFVIVLILIVIPFKLLSYFNIFNIDKLEAQIVARSQSAVLNLMAAADAAGKMDFKSSASEFKNAAGDFVSAGQKLNDISDSLLFLASLSDNPKLKLASESKKFLAAGAIASSLGGNLVMATDSLFAGNQENFSASLDKFIYYGESALEDSKRLKKGLAKIDVNNLPEEYREKFAALSEQAGALSENLGNFVGAASKLKSILGATADKRYLLVFQNNSELRASGGFLGSYALVDIRDGKIRNLEVPGGGSYDTEGGMNVRVVAPEPLWLVDPLWHFWDANWWPDWPTTAKNLMWFYGKSGGPTVDGVISLTPTVVERLLKITGPIDMTNEYGLVIDSDNFWEVTQKIVEQKNIIMDNPENPDVLAGIPATSTVLESSLPLKQNLEINSDNKPKKIIGDLMARIMEILPSKLTKNNLVDILAMFEDSLAEKQILFYFNDPALQAEITKHNWSGEIKDADYDYLMVVDTNIAGQKTDRKIEEKIEHYSEIGIDGSIVDMVKITRVHKGVKNEPLTGVRNVDWLRVYVPAGSELLAAEGFKKPDEEYFDEKPDSSWQENKLVKIENEASIDETSGTKIYLENNKTVFANWVMVDPGESVTVTLKYRLASNFLTNDRSDNWLEKLNALLNPDEDSPVPYSLVVQKQPGAIPSEFYSRLTLPLGWEIFWSDAGKSSAAGQEINDRLNSDKYWPILIKK